MKKEVTPRNIAGVVLAGGRSSRMGVNKALLRYENMPLVEHMVRLLWEAGCRDVFISGEVQGYECIPDITSHAGPAHAMAGLLRKFSGLHDALLFVPVDMPLLAAEDLHELMLHAGSVSYERCPLPALIETGEGTPDCFSVRELLEKAGAIVLPLQEGQEKRMLNVNTPQEWEVIAS